MISGVVDSVRKKLGIKGDVRDVEVVRRDLAGGRTLERILTDRLQGMDNGSGSPTVHQPGSYYGTSTAVHSAVRTLAEAVSRPKMVVWRETANGSDGVDRERVGPDHGLQRLLDRPSPSWDCGELLREIEGSLALWGVAYVAVSQNEGVVGEMRPLHADNVRVVTDRGRQIAGFLHDDGNGREAYLPDEVIWFRRYNPESWFGGFSSLVPARIGVEMGDEALRYNRRFYLNSAMPTDVVITNNEGTPEEVERLMEEWDSRVYDPLLAHRPLVLGGGIDMKRLGSNQDEMEFIGALEWSVEEVSRAFGVPKVFLSEYEDATLSNIQVMEQFLWRNTVIPELKMLENGFNAVLVPGFETGGEKLEIRFDLSDIEAVQESQSEKAERLSGLVKHGIMTVEEARGELGL